MVIPRRRNGLVILCWRILMLRILAATRRPDEPGGNLCPFFYSPHAF